MYEGYYRLTSRPFELTADPRFLFLTAEHREALCHLQYGMDGHAGITVVTGVAGTGKTTLINAALSASPLRRHVVAHLTNPILSRAEFFEQLAASFGLSDAAARSKTRFLTELNELVHSGRHDGVAAALIIDEAQAVPPPLLEEVRLLANLETPSSKLLAVVLVGQPELAARLNEPGFAQLKQRVALRCALPTLTCAQTFAYVENRLRIAGRPDPIFTRDAIELIHQRSEGIPRTINVICDNALLNGFALDRRVVGASMVTEVCTDFDITGGSTSAAEAPAPAPVPPKKATASSALLESQPPRSRVPQRELFTSFGSRPGLSFF